MAGGGAEWTEWRCALVAGEPSRRGFDFWLRKRILAVTSCTEALQGAVRASRAASMSDCGGQAGGVARVGRGRGSAGAWSSQVGRWGRWRRCLPGALSRERV